MKTLPFALIIAVILISLAFYIAKIRSKLPRKKVILLLGPPGSGKGTQAITLAKDLKIPHISTGDLFRQHIRTSTTLGQEVKALIADGKLVPDEIVMKMLFERLTEKDCENGYLLDGFPRTIPQAEALTSFLDGKSEIVAINLDVSDEIITKRIEGRLTCRECGNVQNKYFFPPKVESTCDECGGELVQRPDDSLDAVQERLKAYHTQSKPLLDFYTSKNTLKAVNGEMKTEEVYAALQSAYKEAL
ncbi:MAG: adenylate kinase [Parachlamydiaceae bacterium]|nr:adenylate kinase [Parachlamydiaceae bacterium]